MRREHINCKYLDLSMDSSQVQTRPQEVFCKERCSKVPKAYNFIKKETLAQVFSSEFCEISKDTFFTEHVWSILALQIESMSTRKQ